MSLQAFLQSSFPSALTSVSVVVHNPVAPSQPKLKKPEKPKKDSSGRYPRQPAAKKESKKENKVADKVTATAVKVKLPDGVWRPLSSMNIAQLNHVSNEIFDKLVIFVKSYPNVIRGGAASVQKFLTFLKTARDKKSDVSWAEWSQLSDMETAYYDSALISSHKTSDDLACWCWTREHTDGVSTEVEFCNLHHTADYPVD